MNKKLKFKKFVSGEFNTYALMCEYVVRKMQNLECAFVGKETFYNMCASLSDSVPGTYAVSTLNALFIADQHLERFGFEVEVEAIIGHSVIYFVHRSKEPANGK